MKAKQAQKVPPEAFGPGCRLDAKANTLYGADGHVYTDLVIDYEDFCRLCTHARAKSFLLLVDLR